MLHSALRTTPHLPRNPRRRLLREQNRLTTRPYLQSIVTHYHRRRPHHSPQLNCATPLPFHFPPTILPTSAHFTDPRNLSRFLPRRCRSTPRPASANYRSPRPCFLIARREPLHASSRPSLLGAALALALAPKPPKYQSSILFQRALSQDIITPRPILRNRFTRVRSGSLHSFTPHGWWLRLHALP